MPEAKGESNARWVVIHRNAREHYAVPRLLKQAGLMHEMLTDVWVPPAKRKYYLGMPKIASRWNPELAEVSVHSLGARFLFAEMFNRLNKRQKWWHMTERSDLIFQRAMAKMVAKILPKYPPGILYSFSYDCHEALLIAKEQGWKTVVGQIDPGPLEWDLVEEGSRKYQQFAIEGDRPSAAYWEKWRKEMELADRIVLNSEWSRGLLLRQGIEEEKMVVAPLVYENPAEIQPKNYPRKFDTQRPLRILFLGRIALRKGVGQLLEAMDQLRGQPIELRIAGPLAMTLPHQVTSMPHVTVLPSVGRKGAAELYQWADLFILPTLSDGFAITQLEALACRVPLVVSPFCARIVTHRTDGWLLPEVSPGAIEEALRHSLKHPGELGEWSRRARVPATCSLREVSKIYQKLTEDLIPDLSGRSSP